MLLCRENRSATERGKRLTLHPGSLESIHELDYIVGSSLAMRHTHADARRPSNLAAATQARPEDTIFSAIDRASPKLGGGWMHNTATGESLRIVHPRARSCCLSSAVSSIERSTCFRIAVPSSHRQGQEQAQSEKTSRPLHRCHVGIEIRNI